MRNSQDPLNVAQYSTQEAYQTEKTTITVGAVFWTYVFENFDSKMKKSIMRTNKGEACNARSTVSGRLEKSGAAPDVGGTMRCGKNKMRDQ